LGNHDKLLHYLNSAAKYFKLLSCLDPQALLWMVSCPCSSAVLLIFNDSAGKGYALFGFA
jgi:hypothetical protein